MPRWIDARPKELPAADRRRSRGRLLGAADRAAAVAATGVASRAAPAVDLDFEPAETEIDLGGVTVRTWAYNGQLPGEEIRIRKGERLRAAVTNKLPADTSVHWHGLAIVNDMDGVPLLTQPPIPAEGRFSYDFVVPDAGTYWYHSHVGTQLDRGLYGPLIIEDPNEEPTTTTNWSWYSTTGSTAPAPTRTRCWPTCRRRA